jgi:ubiquinone/menaquinone biosynthesis C-methylase UbiE
MSVDQPDNKPVTTNDLRQDYSTIAGEYDITRFSGRNGQFLTRTDSAIIRSLIHKAGVNKIVDIPTGTGRVPDYLQKQAVKVIGCDLTRPMMERARSRNLSNLAGLIQCDASSLPFKNDSLDCIVCLRFFHLFNRQDRLPFVAEFERVLRPGGHLITSFTNGWYAGGLNWIRQAAGKQTVYFQYPGEMQALFRHWKIVSIRGNFLPFQYYVSLCGQLAEYFARFFTSKWPLNRLCWERFYLLKTSK